MASTEIQTEYIGESPFFRRTQPKERDKAEWDHHFILEMQNIYTPPFEERMAVGSAGLPQYES